ncbi:MAG: hypothetical protein R2823_06970 [Acidimicrobiia bacterium]
MSHAFAGTLLLPGEEGPGLSAVLETVDADVKLVAGEDELGSWSHDECSVTAIGEGSFKVVLGGEMVLFTPDTPIQFANVMVEPEPEPARSVPLADRIGAETKGRKNRVTTPTKVQPLKSVAKQEVLGRAVTYMVVAVSCALMIALLLLSTTL